MQPRGLNAAALLVLLSVGVWGTAGCGMGGTGLPSSQNVDLPDGSTLAATIGSGPASLANTEWAIYRAASNGQGAQFLRLLFDEDGGLERFEDNTIAAEYFGSSIILDGQKHSTTQAGLSYAAGVYGAETSDGMGIAFTVSLRAYAAGLTAATGEASAVATFDDETKTSMRGTFSYFTQATLVDIEGVNQEDEFDFVAHRLD